MAKKDLEERIIQILWDEFPCPHNKDLHGCQVEAKDRLLKLLKDELKLAIEKEYERCQEETDRCCGCGIKPPPVK